MVLLTDFYRNLTSLWIKPRERAFKQFKSPVLNVLRAHPIFYVGRISKDFIWSFTHTKKYSYWNLLSSFYNPDECVHIMDNRAANWWTFLCNCCNSLPWRNNFIQTRLLANYEVCVDAVCISTGHLRVGVANSEILCVSEPTRNKYKMYAMEKRLLTFQ